jgi:hypothetical protein
VSAEAGAYLSPLFPLTKSPEPHKRRLHPTAPLRKVRVALVWWRLIVFIGYQRWPESTRLRKSSQIGRSKIANEIPRTSSNDDWVDEDVDSFTAGIQYLRGAIGPRLQGLSSKYAFSKVYCAVTGIKVGSFENIYASGDFALGAIEQSIKFIDGDLRRQDRIPKPEPRRDGFFLPLVGFGELFGFVMA